MQKNSNEDSGTGGATRMEKLVPIGKIKGGDEEETGLLAEMAQHAQKYLLSFKWCAGIVSGYFAGGLGKVFAIFLFNIVPGRLEVDRWIWIFEGDIPQAYLPLEDAKTSLEAFDTYLSGMKRWVKLAREGKEGTPEDGVPEVNVPATPEWAERLDGRLDFLKENVRPLFK